MNRLRAVINCNRENWNYVFSTRAQSQIRNLLDIYEEPLPEEMSPAVLTETARDAQIMISTWGGIPVTQDILQVCPDLQIIVHGAGSVKGIVTDEVVKRGIRACSAANINAQPVAEFCLGIILVAMKDVLDYRRKFDRIGERGWRELNRFEYAGGYYKKNIGLVGFGCITKYLLNLLKHFDFNIYVSSGHFSEADAKTYHAVKADLDWIMANCDVVSLHSADVPRNHNMINRDNLKLMKPGARLINTARGRLINETDLIERLLEGDIWAYLDVAVEEPPREGHPFYNIQNCVITPHISGSIGLEAQRMGNYCLREIKNFLAGRELENEIDLGKLASIA